jgi:hypothetical protein
MLLLMMMMALHPMSLDLASDAQNSSSRASVVTQCGERMG